MSQLTIFTLGLWTFSALSLLLVLVSLLVGSSNLYRSSRRAKRGGGEDVHSGVTSQLPLSDIAWGILVGDSMSLPLRQLLQCLLYVVFDSMFMYSQIVAPPPEIVNTISLVRERIYPCEAGLTGCVVLKSPTLLPTIEGSISSPQIEWCNPPGGAVVPMGIC